MNSDVGVVWMFISILFFFLGVYVGTKIKDNDNVKIYHRKPKPEEIRIVLENMMMSGSPYEKECIEEAIEIVEKKIEEVET